MFHIGDLLQIPSPSSNDVGTNNSKEKQNQGNETENFVWHIVRRGCKISPNNFLRRKI
jgi:hypothetical protein